MGLFTDRNGCLAFNPATDTVRNDFSKFNFKFGNSCNFSVILTYVISRLHPMNGAVSIIDQGPVLAELFHGADHAQAIQREFLEGFRRALKIRFYAGADRFIAGNRCLLVRKGRLGERVT